MSKSLTLFPITFENETLGGKKNLPCLDNQKMRRKASSTVHTIHTYSSYNYFLSLIIIKCTYMMPTLTIPFICQNSVLKNAG